jgi:hypothetical protein
VRVAASARSISNIALICSLLFVGVGSAEAATQTTTLTISGQQNVVISGLTISTTRGDCIDIVNSTNVTIEASQIGPCGTNNTTNNSRGIYISGNSGGINIYDSYVHVESLASVCGDSHDGIYIDGTTGPVSLQGNVIAYNENNVRIWDASNVTATGNFLLNTRGAATCSGTDNLKGHSFQAWADAGRPNSNITFSNNYVLASSAAQFLFPPAASDYVNFGFSNGIVAQNNWIGGDPAHTDQNACGIIADEAANSAKFINNVVSNTFNGGICIASGTDQIVSGNKVLLGSPTSGAASGIAVANYYSVPCGPVSISNNIAYAIQPSGWLQSFYNHNCGPVAQTNNAWDQAAYDILYPIGATNPPPLVPPQPFSCVVTSPYSTQTSAPPCSGSRTRSGSPG